MSRRARASNAVAILAAVLLTALVAILTISQVGADEPGGGLSGPLYAIDTTVQDLALRARPPAAYLQQPGPDQQRVEIDPRTIISIVAIDERTIAELGAYNGGYPRREHAAVIEQLLAAPPRVLVFDVGFFEPTSDDAVLASALDHARQAGTRVVLADVGLLPRGQLQHAPDGELQLDSGLQPVAGLVRDPGELALAIVLPDARGTIRSMPLLAHVADREQPTLGLAAVASFLRLRQPLPIDGRPASGTLQFAGRQVPVDASRSMLIDYFGPPSDPARGEGTFPIVSFVDVLRGRADPGLWRDRIVFVGALGATGLAEDYWTPVSEAGHKMAGVEIHANVAATLFSTQFLRPVPLLAQILFIVGLSLSVAVAAANLPALAAGLLSLGLLGLAGLGTLLALYSFGLLVSLADPLLAGLGTFLATVAYRVAIEQRQARALHRALAAVVPPGVADQIARQPERIRLGGERRTLTILFADLEEFTPFAERADSATLGRVVADFLQAMTEIVFAHDGTLDKFIGDAVMALWNAPLDDAAHAEHACSAALAMQAALARLGEQWRADGLPRQHLRVGVHTGPASVGNLGSWQRFAYTAIGDSVNLAARLESLNATYGSGICISESTLEAAGGRDRWLVRTLDRVAVKGRSLPVTVYELLGAADDAACMRHYGRLLELYERGLCLYRARDFETAAAVFGAAAASWRDACGEADRVSALYAARCLEYTLSPPAHDWDGVTVLRHK